MKNEASSTSSSSRTFFRPTCKRMSSALMFFFYGYGDHRDLHSFPTRRSSDPSAAGAGAIDRSGAPKGAQTASLDREVLCIGRAARSEEHTSELQSRSDLVC